MDKNRYVYTSVNAIDGTIISSRDNAFLLKNGIALYGGFAGTTNGGREETVSTRSIAANPTILSGDLGMGSSDAYHVILSIGNNSTTVLDGFIIEKGNANGNNIVKILNNDIDREYGGGMYNHNSSAIIKNNIFRNNNANLAGAIYNVAASSPTITNNIFNANGIAAQYGGAIVNHNSSPTIINSTFSDNTALYKGGAISNILGSIVAITNSTFTGNSVFHCYRFYRRCNTKC